jgi:D-sedoheptulose 7-phosphate isomerase
VIPPLVAERITPHTEGLCAVMWHLLVSHPALARSATKWEAVAGTAGGAQ